MNFCVDKEQTIVVSVEFDQNGNVKEAFARTLMDLSLEEKAKSGYSCVVEGVKTREDGSKYAKRYLNNYASNIRHMLKIERNKNNPSEYAVRVGPAVIGKIVNNGNDYEFHEGMLITASEKRSISQTNISSFNEEEREAFAQSALIEREFIQDSDKKHTRTDLHAHLSACYTVDQLRELGDKYNLQIPDKFLAGVGIDVTRPESFSGNQIPEKSEFKGPNGKVMFECFHWNDLSEQAKMQYLNRLHINGHKQQTFAEMDQVYFLRSPFTMITNYIQSEDIRPQNPNDPENQQQTSTLTVEEKNAIIIETHLKILIKSYFEMGVEYAELSASEFAKNMTPEIGSWMAALQNENMQKIYQEVADELGIDASKLPVIRMLGGISRGTKETEFSARLINLQERFENCSAIAGLDVMGHEINETAAFSNGIEEAAAYALDDQKPNPDPFVIRIHAGESGVSDLNIEQVFDAVLRKMQALNPDRIIIGEKGEVSIQGDGPLKGSEKIALRIGHGLHGGLSPSAIKKAKALDAIVELQASSNLALDNIDEFSQIPLEGYIRESVKFVLGTDGFGMYGTDEKEESMIALHLQKTLGLDDCLRDKGYSDIIDYIRATEGAYISKVMPRGREKQQTTEVQLTREQRLQIAEREERKTQLDSQLQAEGFARKQEDEAKKERGEKTKPHEIILDRIELEGRKKDDGALSGRKPIYLIGNLRKEWLSLSESDRQKTLNEVYSLLTNIDPEKFYVEVSPFSDNGGFSDSLLSIIEKINEARKQTNSPEIISMAHVPVHEKYQNLDKISKKIRYLDISGKGEIGLGNDNFSKSSINTTRDVMASQGMVVAFGEGFGDSDIIDTAHNYILNEEIDFVPGVAESSRTSGAQLRIFSPLAASKFKFLRGNGYEFDSAESILSPEMRRRVSEMDLSPEEQQQFIQKLVEQTQKKQNQNQNEIENDNQREIM